ncbi:MAG: DUF4097 family beta strand repeat-containing protein [Gemmatimonadota bacterium]
MTLLALLTTLVIAPCVPGPVAVASPALDTIVELRPGDRVVLRDLSGSVTVEAVDGDRMEVKTGRQSDEIGLRRTDGRVVIGTAGKGASERTVDVALRVPVWADLEIEGHHLDVSVRGMAGAITVGSVSGDVRVEGTSGPVRAWTMAGEIVAESTSGALYLSSHSDDVRVRAASGPVEAQSLAGDLFFEALSSASVRGETQAGDMIFTGDIVAGGRYHFFLHAGDARLELPRDLSARVRVSTFHGTFESDFPVRVSGFTSGRPFEFTVGEGGAEVRVEVFDGAIRLVRGNR